jgi:hypothetical protein
MYIAKVLSVATTLLASTLSVVAIPQASSVYVGLGNQCGWIGGVNYQCWPGMTCDRMPGAATKTCIYISSAGGTCNPDHYKCASGLKCVTPPGQWNGVCKA